MPVKTGPLENYAYCSYEVRFLNFYKESTFQGKVKKPLELGISFSMEQIINSNWGTFYSSNL
jgi:hypothetical protein